MSVSDTTQSADVRSAAFDPPAFPSGDKAAFPTATFEAGMSLRDWFAGQVVAQCIRNALADDGSWEPENAAYHAYLVADAMLTERSR